MRCLATALLLALLPAVGGAAWGDRIADRLSRGSTWDYNMSIFESRLEEIFPDFLPAQRTELAARVAWARRGVRLEQAALKPLGEAAERVREGAEGPPGYVAARRRALRDADHALRRYLALFAPEVARALGAYPRAAYQRMLERLEDRQGHERAPALLAATEAAVLDFAKRCVGRISSALVARRRALYLALQDLQLSRSALEPRRWARLDRTFFQLQALFAEPAEPGYGRPLTLAFPVEALLAERVTLRLSAHAAGLGELAPPTTGGPTGAAGALLSRQAVRLKELDDLSARYPASLLAEDPARRAAAWRDYRELRERWDRIGGEGRGGLSENASKR